MPSSYYSADIKSAIAKSKNPFLFPELNIPRTTALYWIKNSHKFIEKRDPNKICDEKYAEEIYDLKKKISDLETKISFLKKATSCIAVNLENREVPKAEHKQEILRTIECFKNQISLKDMLSHIGLSLGRYKKWKAREKICCLDNMKRCPRSLPHQLTSQEKESMKKLAQDPKFAHFSIPSLRLYALRHNILACSVDTWRAYIQKEGWRDGLLRKKDRGSKKGVRATFPNQIWHIDLTEIKLPNNSRYYVQAIIDNYSRCILSYSVSSNKRAEITRENIEASLSKIRNHHKVRTQLFVDEGSENNNHIVEDYLSVKPIDKIIAQIDVRFSNSMIESFFKRIKHSFIYQKNIKTKSELVRHIDFYINEYNKNVPQACLSGATPTEQYLETWNSKEQNKKFKDAALKARNSRLEVNRSIRCKLLSA